jgi:hypothetical protein
VLLTSVGAETNQLMLGKSSITYIHITIFISIIQNIIKTSGVSVSIVIMI